MKLHYFNQNEADADDVTLALMKDVGTVPPGCLLGGVTARAMVLNGNPPCDNCKGPRERCGGSALLTDEQLRSSAELYRLERMITGEASSTLDELIKQR